MTKLELPPDFVWKSGNLYHSNGKRKKRIKVAKDCDVEYTAWRQYLNEELDEIPDPPTPLLVRYLCALYGEVKSPDSYWDSNFGQTAAARHLHMDPRTVRRWVNGKSRNGSELAIPWAPVQLLFRDYRALLESDSDNDAG